MGILKRTVFFYPGDHLHGKQVRFIDWASVVTTIGQCHEPWTNTMWHPDAGIVDSDVEDEVTRIDEIKAAGRNRMRSLIVDDSGQEIHGGLCWPRKVPI